ncbi:MAG: ParB N-terminal domain-containing protein [Deltaproteobacteria bacterium]|nr:ParB N-terminal domain-containing protein [Deltaproteobacteria bacterium]
MEKQSVTEGKGVKTEVFTNMSEDKTQTFNSGEKMKGNDIPTPKMAEAIDNKKGERTVAEIPLDFLFVEYHPRKNLGDLTSLQGSIKRDGLQEPILVYEAGEKLYGVIDGCRRLTAIKELGWKSVPCLINKGINVRDAAHLSYVKNSERNNFDPIEVATHLKAMIERFGYSMRDLEIKG